VEAGPTPGRVKTGVGSVSRGARTEHNSPDRSMRPTLQFGTESIFTTDNFVKRLLTYLGKFLDRLPKLGCDFPQLRLAQKQWDFFVENVGTKRGNLSVTVRNVVCKMRYLS